MKLTFPHLGNAYLAIEALVEGLGHEPMTPPITTTRTLAMGSGLSPEEICLPFKIVLGNMLEGLELGAEGILMLGGYGPCRLGYYGEVQKRLLRQGGKEPAFFSLELPRANFVKFGGDLKRLFVHATPNSLQKGARLAWAKLGSMENVERLALIVRPREKYMGTTATILKQCAERLRATQSMSAIRQIQKQSEQELYDLLDPKPTRGILKVGVVGEIYTVLEPFANLNLEARLGSLGVEIVRTISLRSWIWDHVLKKIVGIGHLKPLERAAQGYLRGFIGGHGLESVAHGVDLARENLAGIIHVFPLSCAPEVVAQGILAKVSVDYGIPILTLVVDEHSAELGLQTRLEAFVDLLERRQDSVFRR